MTEPVGEDAWLALVDEASRTAGNIDHRTEVVELYKRAVAAEPWSNKLWLACCEWLWSLHIDCQNGDAGWTEEEQQFGQELFPLEVSIDMWQQGAQATQYRINDSHELWNRWIAIESQLLSTNPTNSRTDRIKSLYLQRLRTPHATWSETSAAFSSFLSKFDNSSYEQMMVEVTKDSQSVKELYTEREPFELELKKAVDAGDGETVKDVMQRYLEWEGEPRFVKASGRSKKQKLAPPSPPILRIALYERALTYQHLGRDASVWEDYIVYISSGKFDTSQVPVPPILSVLQRATSHCPWSGALWARYILSAESQQLPFETMEQIKHAATNNRELDRDGIASVVEFYAAWVGFLKRRTQITGATDDDVDLAEMGLPTALESVTEWGQKRHGKKDFKGDPQFRIENIYIQHLTHQRRYDDAREQWKKLVTTHGDSYEFWQQYYLWEMSVRSPSMAPVMATGVLVQAVERKGLDWPEKLMEIYVRHCNTYEHVDVLLNAMSTVHNASKAIARRREREARQAAEYYAQQQSQAVEAVEDDASPSGKRKREDDSQEDSGNANKKAKSAEEHEAARAQQSKRDRENTSILVTNLPSDASKTTVRKFFKGYGHINNITVKTVADESSATCLIDFRSPEDVLSALLRDGKFFGDKPIKVVPGTGLTLYLTNYPPTWGEADITKLFKDCGDIFNIRFPSLQFNTHRVFCYVTFLTAEGAAAATEMDGRSLGGQHKLVAKYSDPTSKKTRDGAKAEGREIHITSIDLSLSEDDLREVFSKYGKIESARLLTNKVTGQSQGAGFIAFENKDSAVAALELDKTKLKSRILTVGFSKDKNFNPTSTIHGKGTSMSPAPDADGDSVMSASPGPGNDSAAREDRHNRTITLMNIPDTFNAARLEALVQPHGDYATLKLRPDHQGAIIEFKTAGAAGKAALSLDGHEIEPGRRLRTGNMKELLAEKPEVRSGYLTTGAAAKKATASTLMPAPPVRRPVGPGGRGGLGQKRGLGFSAAKPASEAGTNGQSNGTGDKANKTKSNADFKAMFVSGGTQ